MVLEVVVKHSEPGHTWGLLEFQAEIMVLSGIHRQHLLSLIGYCNEKYGMILVYEFMENGTLRHHFAAKGLQFLHPGADGVIIHRDVKLTNILLDKNFVTKVADFDLSKANTVDQSQVVTDHIKGSFCYFDLEYFGTLQLVEKSDVYSFGVGPTMPEDVCSSGSTLGSEVVLQSRLIQSPYAKSSPNFSCQPKPKSSIGIFLIASNRVQASMNPLWTLLALLQISSNLNLSSAYSPPDKYFINCGSDANVTDSGRTFVGDVNPTSFSLSAHQSSQDGTSSSTASALYQTARIFKKQSSYEFATSGNGTSTHFIRLHFFAFSSTANLPSSSFSVSTSEFTLLDNFSGQNSSKSPVIKEFLISIKTSKFKIYFTPQKSSFAFVNAIEVFIAPPSLILDDAQEISPTGKNSTYKGLLSKVLQLVLRIDVGGSATQQDSLWRSWAPDDSYLSNPSSAVNDSASSSPSYVDTGAPEYSAPDFVYQTAKFTATNSSNITWNFNVKENTTHFLRVHFCDIISQSLKTIKFNLYINAKFHQYIDPYFIPMLAAPFYKDFVVDSNNSGFLSISIVPSQDVVKSAFLNGVEIMEIKSNSGPVFKKSLNVRVLIGSVLGGITLVCILVVAVLLVLKRRKPKLAENVDWSQFHDHPGRSDGRLTELSTSVSSVANLKLRLRITLQEILSATNNFDTKLMIGKGGFGSVYRGTVRNGLVVAVKRSEPGSGQGLSEFQTEIVVLSKIRHRHLVSLIGYCDDRNEMILVYEFMEKGTLRSHLYGSDLPRLSWKQRLEICIGSARGLHYLHTGLAGGVIHRDVKSTNILLDENFVAKVADFGISRLGVIDQAHVSTGIKGTFGYLDPEYFKTQQLTDKSDVYSFGVLLLEVLCARPAIDVTLPREQVNLAEWGMLWQTKGLLNQIIDPFLAGQINPSSLKKFGETVEKCLGEDSSDRPSMGDVLWDLEYALQLQKTAVQRQPHDDTTTDRSSNIGLPNIHLIPSISMSFAGDDASLMNTGFDMTESEIFSQLKMDDGRKAAGGGDTEIGQKCGLGNRDIEESRKEIDWRRERIEMKAKKIGAFLVKLELRCYVVLSSPVRFHISDEVRAVEDDFRG
ncbi:Malectin-like domain [Dillenia turbinata]|uniref:Malectin-like domain n=1 Tax=Dillenia turbinata TaxID=194707 RepID=A0AAN8UTV2_9MAGN